MRYKACVFDFDLTLADSSEGILKSFKHTLTAFGCPLPDDKTIYDTIGLPLIDAFGILTGVPNEPRRFAMRDEYVRKADEVMVAGTYFYKGVVDGLKALRERGVLVGVCSSKMRYRIEQSFDVKAGCRPVDLIIGLDDAERPKPDPCGLYKCLEGLGVAKKDALYVGDNIIDAKTAQNAGVDFAAVLTGSTTEREFSEFPNVAVCKDLAGLLANIKCK